MPAGELDIVVELVVGSQPSTTSQKPKPFSSAEKNLLATHVLAAHDAVDVEHADLDVGQAALLDDGARRRRCGSSPVFNG